MTFDELKAANKKLERKANLCYANMEKNRELYKKQNEPLHLRKYERITVRLRVTEESRKHLTDKEKNMKKYWEGHEYTVRGSFIGWYIHDDGSLRPCFFRGPQYSMHDEIVSIVPAKKQPHGRCSKCHKYKDGYCYMAGGMDMGRKYATDKVSDNDYTCPLYEEMLELWTRDGRHLPNVVYLRNAEKPEFHIYSINWKYYEKWEPTEVRYYYLFEKPDLEEEDQ